MKKRVFSILLVAGLFLSVVSRVSAAVTWTETQPAGNTTQLWFISAMSSNGQDMLTGVEGGRLYLSTNGGGSWTETQPAGNNNEAWEAGAMSSDGQTIFVGINGGRLYRSVNGGTSWTETQPAGNTNGNWGTISMSPDGQTVLVGAFPGRLYISTNGGTSWTETQPAGNNSENWQAAAVSSNDETLLAGIRGGRLYLSTNSGASWTETQPAGNTNAQWFTAGIDANGKTMLAGADSGRLYISSNGGISWSEVQPAGDNNENWTANAMTSDGKFMVVTNYGGRMYVSQNAGTSWTETQPAGNTNQDWQGFSMSSDTSVMLADIDTGRVYIGSGPAYIVVTPTSTPSNSSGSSNLPSAPSCGDAAPTNAPNLFEIDAKGNTATLYFVPVSGPNNKYYISYGVNSDAMGFGVEFPYSTTSGVIPYTVNALFPGTWYFKVRGGNGCMPGNWSQVMSVKVIGFDSTSNLTNNNVLGAATVASVTSEKCSTYTVQAGDSLWSIASQQLGNGTNFGSIMKSNNLSSSLIHTDQMLKVGC